MSKSCKVLSIVAAVYLASGLVNMILGQGVLAVAQVVYAACFVVGVLAAVAAFTGPAKRYRPLGLWSVAPLIPICGTGDWGIFFPGLPKRHLAMHMGWQRGTVFLGVDVVPLLLFVLIWAFSEKLIKEQQAAAAPGR